MDSSALIVTVLGVFLIASISVDGICQRTGLPRISGLVLLGVGFAAIQQYLGLPPGADTLGALTDPLVTIALVMVAFLLGGDLGFRQLSALGRPIMIISAVLAIVTAAVVMAGLAGLGFPITVAILLAAIATATDPAAVQQVTRQAGAQSPRIRLVLGIVAIDDAWGILAFGLALATVGLLTTGDGLSALTTATWELGGAVILGAAIGFPAAWLTGRLQPGEPTQAEAIAIVLLIAGLSEWLGVTPLLTAIVAGMVVANRSPHHNRTFREIENIEWPFLVFFFVLAGASIRFDNVLSVLPLAVVYIVLRTAGRWLGGWVGKSLASADDRMAPRDLGIALTPQAGVAMGMALLAAEKLPEVGQELVAAAVLSTVFFELVGPVVARKVLLPEGRH